MNKKLLGAAVAIPALAIATWAVLNQSSTAKPAAPGVAVVPVGTVQVGRQDFSVRLSGVGTVQAFTSVTVRPQVDGQLQQILFKEGQDVQAGQPLAQIDSRSYQAALEQALSRKGQDAAQLRNVRLQVERNGILVEKQYVARQTYDTLKAQADQLESALKGDEAAIDQARIQLGYTTVRAPSTGRAGIRQVDPGNIVHSSSMDSSHGGSSSSDSIVVITQLQPISVVFTLPQEQLPGLLKAKAQHPLTVEVFGREGGQPLDAGQLQVIDNQVDAATGMVKLKAELPNKSGLLWPGQFVSVQLLESTHPQAVTVPGTAVQRGAQGREFVYVLKDDNTVAARDVVSGAVDGETIEVIKGLEPGETVVTSGHYRLQPGTKVARSESAAP